MLHHNFPSIDQLETQLAGKAVKINQLTELQKKILQATIKGRNTVVIQPTESGKSLFFQLPPLVSSEKSVVNTQTISLMQDRILHLPTSILPHRGYAKVRVVRHRAV